MILIDPREDSNIIRKVKLKCKETKEEFLECGDYLLDGEYVIERKSRDLIQSIINNRLYDQLNSLCQYEHPILAITIDNLWKDFYFSNSKYIHKSYLGMLSSLTVSYPNLKIMFFQDTDQFVDYIYYLDKRIHKDTPSVRPSPILAKKGYTLQERKENCLTAIEGIGVPMAQKLLECFGSIKNIANASVDELMLVEKVGKKLAENIHKTLN